LQENIDLLTLKWKCSFGW